MSESYTGVSFRRQPLPSRPAPPDFYRTKKSINLTNQTRSRCFRLVRFCLPRTRARLWVFMPGTSCCSADPIQPLLARNARLRGESPHKRGGEFAMNWKPVVPLIALDRLACSLSRDAIGFQDKSQFDQGALRIEDCFAVCGRF